MYSFFPKMLATLRGGLPIALATVVKQRGSLPMASDAKLLVHSDGTIEGTIGGGCLEAEVYATAKRLLREGGASVDEFHLNEVEASTGGHVCGGTVLVLTRVFQPQPDTVEFFECATTQHDAADKVRFVSRVNAASAHALVVNGRVEGGLGLTPESAPALSGTGLVGDGDDVWFVEPVRELPLLIVFGGGHCGVAIGAAASTAGYRVWVLEDRPTFLDAERMPWASRLRRVDFAALPRLPLNANTSLAIVTRGHEHDLVVLRQVLDSSVGYLGMIGSRRKRELFRRILRDEGRDVEAFDRVRSPMGLDIGAQTPAEIAVSVVAELVAVRRSAAASQRASLASESVPVQA